MNWRAGPLGRLLRIHSPTAHVYGGCWCQPKPRGKPSSFYEGLKDGLRDAREDTQ